MPLLHDVALDDKSFQLVVTTVLSSFPIRQRAARLLSFSHSRQFPFLLPRDLLKFFFSFFFSRLRVTMSAPHKAVPLVAPGHTRPVTHLSFSPLLDDRTYLLVSSCKDGNPMLREWTGDWIGTFVGHKGAVWSTKLSRDGSRAASGSADFTAWVFPTEPVCVSSGVQLH